VEPVSLLIGTTLALFCKGRAKGGAWHDLEKETAVENAFTKLHKMNASHQ